MGVIRLLVNSRRVATLTAPWEAGSLIITDGLGLYRDVELAGYERATESTADGMRQKEVLRHFHLVVSNLKAWLHGTLHGGISGKHLQAYLNEFSFRTNRRNNRQAAFQTILGLASTVRGPTYRQLYADADEPDGWQHPGLLGADEDADPPPFDHQGAVKVANRPAWAGDLRGPRPPGSRPLGRVGPS